MPSRRTEFLNRVPNLRRFVRRRRNRWHQAVLARTERLISRQSDYEILVVFGMRRSGNHYAINWILGQIDGAAAFYNNIDPARAPYTGRMTEYRLRRGKHPRIVLSYEDTDPAEMLAGPLADYLAERTARDQARVRFAVILRDPCNLFASRIAKWPERFVDPRQIAAQQQLYRSHAALAADARPVWRDAPLIPLIYNDMVRDPAVRAAAADALGIRRGDRGIDAVPVYGHGSSFAGTTQSASDLRDAVFDRWRTQASDKAFTAVMADADLARIGRERFGIDPDQR